MTYMCGTRSTGYPARMTETTESGATVDVWTQWRREFPPLDIDRCPAMVLAGPHPGDETLGLGATAALLAGRGVTVQVVAITNGECAYPRRPVHTRAELAEQRREELLAAAIRLGIPRPWFLGLPDGKVSENEGRVVHALREILEECPAGTWCASTWRGDGPPDHEATARAAATASQEMGAKLVEYPVSMWRWATPDDPAVPWDRARRVPLTPLELATKAVAVQLFSSQLEPGDGPPALTPQDVDRQMAVGEIVFV